MKRRQCYYFKKAQSGALNSNEADKLASQALEKKNTAFEQASSLQKGLSQQEIQTNQLEKRVQDLKQKYKQMGNELTTLRARAKVAQASKKLNKQLAQVDSSSTLNLLEKMKTKVAEDEALAESYGDMASLSDNIDDQIDKALQGSQNTSTQDSLAELKAKNEYLEIKVLKMLNTGIFLLLLASVLACIYVIYIKPREDEKKS